MPRSSGHARSPGFGSGTGLLVAPAAWLLAQQASSLLPTAACSGGYRLPIAIVNLAFLAVCLAGGWPSWRAWREAGHLSPVAERRRFLGIVGTFATLLFALAIVSQGMVDLFFSGCER